MTISSFSGQTADLLWNYIAQPIQKLFGRLTFHALLLLQFIVEAVELSSHPSGG